MTLRLNDGTNEYTFPFVKTDSGGFGFTLENAPWEPGDPIVRWRIPVHPFIGGLHIDRLHGNPKTYASGPVDGSYPNIALFPPKFRALTGANLQTPVKAVNFDSKMFLIGGRYVYYYNPADDTLTEDEDLGVGVSAVDACVFNNELVIACGAATKIFTRNTAGTYTQATNNTFAIALGVVGSLLWRAHDTNQMSNCSSAPLTLANYQPADPNEYTVGDTTYAINAIIDYGGIPWALKGDGAYAPDPQSRFKNQTPAAAKTPHVDNGKGAWVAQGALWFPSSSGLYRIKPGKNPKRGPEVTFRPSYRWWVRGGFEYGDWMYLLSTDEASAGKTCVVRMGASDLNADHGLEYVYQHWADLDSTSKGYFIGLNTAGTNPRVVAGYGSTGVRYAKLGRGGGRDVDDPFYPFDTAMVIESGAMMPANDVTMLSTLVGVDTACDFSRTGDSLTVAYRYDSLLGTESYTNLLDTAEGGGSAAITTSGFTRATRYAAPNIQGRLLELKFTGAAAVSGTANAAVTTSDTTLADTRLALTTNAFAGVVLTCNGKTMTVTSNTATTFTGASWSGGSNPGNGLAWSSDVGGMGTSRAAIREAWAHGYSHQQMTDVISVAIDASTGAQANGKRTGLNRAKTIQVLRDWQNDGVELTGVLAGYETGRTTRFLIRKVEEINIDASPGNGRGGFDQSSRVNVQLLRIDRAGTIAEAVA